MSFAIPVPRRAIAGIGVLVAVLAGTHVTHAATYAARVRWAPSPGPGVAGYRVTVHPTAGGSAIVVDAGLPAVAADGSLATQVSGLDGRTDYTVTATAYASDGQESGPSNAIAIGYARVAGRIDSDGDGLSDAAEDRNLNRTLDAGETDALNADTDGDRVRDGADLCQGTAAGAGVDASGCSCAQVTCNDGIACTTDTCTNGTCSSVPACPAGQTCNVVTGACTSEPGGGVSTIWPDTAAPARPDRGADQPVELGVKFRSDVAGYVTGIRFYKHPLNTGAHVGSLWSTAGAPLAVATFTSETASGWQQVTFPSPVAIAANTVYVASYYCPNGHYSFDVGAFATQGVDRPPLHALANGVAGPNGVYVYGTTSMFPNQSYSSTNYWVDVMFSAGTPPPPPPISITTASLPAGTVGTTYAAQLVATGGTPPYVWSVASGALPAGLTLNAGTGAITGRPTAAGTFTVTAQARAGTQSASRALGITIGQQQQAASSLWPAGTVPVQPDGGPDGPVELGIKFRSDVAGYVTGIRFYKHALNTGLHLGNLWSSTGARLATAIFTNESASGWQQVTFASPVPIAANTIYVASYHCSNGHYSEDLAYFQSRGVDRPPLHAPANGVSGANSVYAYGATSIFPTRTWWAANYWVDLVFTTTPPSGLAGVLAASATSVGTVAPGASPDAPAPPEGAARLEGCVAEAAPARSRRRGAYVDRLSLEPRASGSRLRALGRFAVPDGLDLERSGMTLALEDDAQRLVLAVEIRGGELEPTRNGWKLRAAAGAIERLVVHRRYGRILVSVRGTVTPPGVPDATRTLSWRVGFGDACPQAIQLTCTGDSQAGLRCRQ